MSQKKDFSEVIFEALQALPGSRNTDEKLFMAMIQDLATEHPSQKKFLLHNCDGTYLQMCSRAMQAGDSELGHIAREASQYLQREFATSEDRADKMSEYIVRAYAACGRNTVPAQISWHPVYSWQSAHRRSAQASVPPASGASAESAPSGSGAGRKAAGGSGAGQRSAGGSGAGRKAAGGSGAGQKSAGGSSAGRKPAGGSGAGQRSVGGSRQGGWSDASKKNPSGASASGSGSSQRSAGANAASAGKKSKSNNILYFVIAVAVVLAGIWYYHNSHTVEQPRAEDPANQSEWTHYLRNISFTLPAEYEESKFLYTEDFSVDLQAHSGSASEYETPVVDLADQLMEDYSDQGYTSIESGKVRIGKEASAITGQYVECEHDGIWEQEMLFPVRARGRVVHFNIKSMSSNGQMDLASVKEAKELRDWLVDVLDPFYVDEYTSSDYCGICGLSFPYKDLTEGMVGFSFPFGGTNSTGIDSIEFEIEEKDGDSSAESFLAEDFPFSDMKDGVLKTESGTYTLKGQGSKDYGSVDGYWYEYYYGENLWHYRVFFEDDSSEVKKPYIYVIEMSLDREADAATVRSSVDDFMATVKPVQ